MKKVWTVVVVAALAAPIVYRLCLSHAEDPGAAGTTITYMAWGYPSQLGTERRLIETFQRDNPDVRVRFMMAPMRSYFDKLGIMFASGTAPDVVRVFPTYFAHYAKVGYLKQLDSLMAADADYNPEDFFKQARDVGIFEGRHYGLGVIFGKTLVYYNRTAFRKADVEEPWESFQKGRWTWQATLEAARKLTLYDGEGRPVQFGMNFPGDEGNILSIVKANGGEYLSADGRKSLLNTPPVMDVINWIGDLRWKWAVTPTPEQGALSVFSFESGRLAMEIDASGESPRLRDAIKDFEWDVAPMPYGAQGRTGGYGAHVLVMNAKTPRADAAWRFMRFVTGPTAERLLAVELRRCIPTRRALAFSEEYLSASEPPFNMGAFIADIDEPQEIVLPDEKYLEWTSTFQAYLDQIWLGTKSPRQAMYEAAERIDKILNSS